MNLPVSRLRATLRGHGAILRLLYFAYYSAQGAYMPFFSIYLRQAGLTGLQIGTLSGMRPAVVLLTQPLWGIAADLYGRRRILLLTLLLAALLLPGFAWSGSYWFLVVWTGLFALLTNPSGSLIDSLVLDHLEERRSASFGQVRLWGSIGWAVVALVAGAAIGGRDIRLIFGFSGALMLLCWFVAWRGTHAGGEAPRSGGRQGAAGLLSRRPFAAFLALIVLIQLGLGGIFTFFSVYMTELGASRELIGSVTTLQGLSEIPFFMLSAAIIRRLGPARTLALAVALGACRILLYSVLRAPVLALGVEFINGAAFPLCWASAVEYANRQVPGRWRATGQAILSAAYFGAGGILGNTWAGFLYDHLGVRGMFRINGVFLLAVALAVLFVLRAGSGVEREAA